MSSNRKTVKFISRNSYEKLQRTKDVSTDDEKAKTSSKSTKSINTTLRQNAASSISTAISSKTSQSSSTSVQTSGSGNETENVPKIGRSKSKSISTSTDSQSQNHNKKTSGVQHNSVDDITHRPSKRLSKSSKSSAKCKVVFKNHEVGTSSPSIVDESSTELLTESKAVGRSKVKGSKSRSKKDGEPKKKKSGSKVFKEVTRVEKAIKEGRIFEILGQVNPIVRSTMLKRGWIEKTTNSNSISRKSGDKMVRLKDFNPKKWPVAQKLLYDVPANFVWADWGSKIMWSEVQDWQIINKNLQDGTSKKVLADVIKNLQWVGTEPDTCTSTFPRTYHLNNAEEKEAFVQDYKMTACLSLLKWFVHSVEEEAQKEKESAPTTSSSETWKSKSTKQKWPIHWLFHLLDFVVLQIRHYIAVRNHEDLDMRDKTSESSSEIFKKLDWDTFLHQSYLVIHDKVKFEVGPKNSAIADEGKTRYIQCTDIIKQVGPFWPQSEIDGLRNIWIFKPNNGSLGKGIFLMDKFWDISKKFLDVDTTHSLFLAQKYIERPLLVHRTKFDIRQWFLISSWNPLVAWIYKKCYLRLSSKVFNPDDLNERIHLTNNRIQVRYAIDPQRHADLPTDNTWSLTDFENYLENIGHAEVWSKVIYPGIKASILTILLAARESRNHRPGSFHIQGADFMISEDFRPWLLEINSKPILATNRPITAKLSKQCLVDTIKGSILKKVILDCRGEMNPEADTGAFELLYEGSEGLSPKSKIVIDDPKLLVQGRKIPNLLKMDNHTVATA